MSFGVKSWLQLSDHGQVISSLQVSISTPSYAENSNSGISTTGLLGIVVGHCV